MNPLPDYFPTPTRLSWAQGAFLAVSPCETVFYGLSRFEVVRSALSGVITMGSWAVLPTGAGRCRCVGWWRDIGELGPVVLGFDQPIVSIVASVYPSVSWNQGALRVRATRVSDPGALSRFIEYGPWSHREVLSFASSAEVMEKWRACA